MKRRIGFVSNVMTSDEENLYMKRFKLATFQKRGLEKVIETYKENLEMTSTIIRYCKNVGIKFYRMGSLFPFSTHKELENFDYLNYFDDDIYELSQLIKISDTRISIHSSPYCILNSVNPETVKKAVTELTHHAKFMNLLNLPASNRTVVHTGGIEGGREAAKKRFVDNFNRLHEDVKKRVVLENDDKVFSFKDVEDISKQTEVPVVIDIFHHRVFNPESLKEIESLERACKTWKEGETPEIHYSSQEPEKVKGSHSATLDFKQFTSFLNSVTHLSFDVMLEVKDTHRSVEKVINELGENAYR